MISKLTFEIVLQNKHNSFHALQCQVKSIRYKESLKKEHRNRQNNYHAPVTKEQLITAQKQNKKLKKYDTHPLSPTQTLT